MYVNETGYLEIERIRVKLNYFIPNFVFWEKTWILHANKCYVIINYTRENNYSMRENNRMREIKNIEKIYIFYFLKKKILPIFD